jgi:hypothetical protein
MVTNYPQPMAAHGGFRTTERHERSGGFVRAMAHVRTMLCGLRGHDTMLHFAQERMTLRCVSCGHETPGWDLDEAPPTVTVRGDARRHALARPRLVRTRRVA